MFNWCSKRNLIETNPYDNGNIASIKRPESDPENYFSIEEVEEIINSIRTNTELRKLVILALETGGRITELISLRWRDIDLERKRIYFRHETTKTKQSRYVPLRDTAIKELSTWKHSGENIFKWKNYNVPSRSFRLILVRLGYYETTAGKPRSFHTLRHTYASHLLAQNVDILKVSRWLGHSSVTITLDIYGHMIPDNENEEIAKLPFGSYMAHEIV